jgi:hypothetical protein
MFIRLGTELASVSTAELSEFDIDIDSSQSATCPTDCFVMPIHNGLPRTTLGTHSIFRFLFNAVVSTGSRGENVII